MYKRWDSISTRHNQTDRSETLRSLSPQLVHNTEPELEEEQAVPTINIKLVRQRQVVQHAQLLQRVGDPIENYVCGLLKKAWLKSLFKEIVQDASKELFQNSLLKNTFAFLIAQKYLSELFNLSQSIKQGYRLAGNLNKAKNFKLGDLMKYSDEALYEALSELNNKFQSMDEGLVKDAKRIVDYQKYSYNILQNKSLEAKCTQHGAFANRDFIYSDLTDIINKAQEEFESFQEDMQFVCGTAVKCRLKVSKLHNQALSLVDIRKVLQKWLFNLMECDRQLVQSKAYDDFFKNKQSILDNFYIRPTEHTPSTQQKIVEVILQLLANSAYEGSKYNDQFGLYLYDTLKAEYTYHNILQIERIVEKMCTLCHTKRKVQVFRVVNRLMLPQRDVIINFRYGDLVTGELKAKLSFSQNKQELLKQNQYKMLLFTLKQSVIGPTIELVRIYEENIRVGSIAKMYSVGRVTRREDPLIGISLTSLLCPVGHTLLYIGNKELVREISEICRNCLNPVINSCHLYCHYCFLIYCQECQMQFRKKNQQQITYKPSSIVIVDRLNQLRNIPDFSLVLLHLTDDPASKLMVHFLFQLSIQNQFRNLPLYILTISEATNIANINRDYGVNIQGVPCFVLLHNGAPCKIVQGASIYKIYQYILIILNNKIVNQCPNSHKFSKIGEAAQMNLSCHKCHRMLSQPSLAEICPTCLYVRCFDCGFPHNNQKSYCDQSGMSYLGTRIPNGNRVCQKGHPMTFFLKNPFQQHLCHVCQNEYQSEPGIFLCTLCGQISCRSCSISTNCQDQLANHSVDPYLMDMPPCVICNTHFKLKKKQENWACNSCRQNYGQYTSTIVCESCESIICLKCANQLKTNLNSLMSNINQSEIPYCVCRNKMVPSSLMDRSNGRVFTCDLCHHSFYFNTLHFQCPIYCKNPRAACVQCVYNQLIRTKIVIIKCVNGSWIDFQQIVKLSPSLTIKEIIILLKQKNILSKKADRLKSAKKYISADLQDTVRLKELGKQPIFYNFEIPQHGQQYTSSSIIQRKRSPTRRFSKQSSPRRIQDVRSEAQPQLLPELEAQQNCQNFCQKQCSLM